MERGGSDDSPSFADRVNLCGLCHQEVADYLDRSLDAVRSWSNGRRTAPDDAMADLAELWVIMTRTENIVDRKGRALPPAVLERRALMQAVADAADRSLFRTWLECL